MNQHDKAERGGRERPLSRADAITRKHLIRRQNLVYLSLIATGAIYSAGSPLVSPALIAEGVAFIMVGFVGLVMSLTTVDIGKSLKDATHEEGEMTRTIIREEGEMTRTVIREAVDALGERLGASIEAMSADVKTMSADIKAMSADNRAFFRQMLEAQNRILEKVS